MRATLFSLLALSVLTLSACGEEAETVVPSIAAESAPKLSGPKTSGKGGGTGGQKVLASVLQTEIEAAEFLRKAGMGPTEQSIDALTGDSAVNWVARQLDMPPRGYKADLSSRLSEDDADFPQLSQLIYEDMIVTDAELRSRMTYALSQIFVVNGSTLNGEGYGLAEWYDILDRNAFGNYRDLMGEVTRSPIMGRYLTFLFNQKGDPKKGRSPDENYARELLQLFTIGLVELKMDGTPKLGADGLAVETYTNDDVIGLARVFTGYLLAGSSHHWEDRYEDTWERPMMMYEPRHSDLEKRFLGTVIPENTLGEASIDQALDTIFAHPNVAPFVSRLLIQRFTSSDPHPDYVRRVATAFETGRYAAEDGKSFGTGQRGDLAATVAAIILDRTQHDPYRAEREGKVREPVLNFVQMARAYKSVDPVLVNANWSMFSDTSDLSSRLAQSPLRSPSVFNFYRPGYVAPGTKTGEAGLAAPEMQIVNGSSTVGYTNFMYDFITRTKGDYVVIPDFAEEVALAHEPEQLVDQLDLKLTVGTMSPGTRAAIIDTLEALPIRENQEDNDRLSRVRLAVIMVATSPEYMTLN